MTRERRTAPNVGGFYPGRRALDLAGPERGSTGAMAAIRRSSSGGAERATGVLGGVHCSSTHLSRERASAPKRLTSSLWSVPRNSLWRDSSQAAEGAEPPVRQGTRNGTPGHRKSMAAACSALQAVTAPSSQQVGKAATLNTAEAGDTVVGHTWQSWLSQLFPRLIRMQPLIVLSLGLVFFWMVLLGFAVVFFLIGDGCFAVPPGERFSFLQMTWLSVHTISTVGYGTISPTCFSAQFVVGIESYCSVLVQAAVSAYVVFVMMRSRTRIRFSKNCLITRGDVDPELGERPIDINFRLIRNRRLARGMRSCARARARVHPHHHEHAMRRREPHIGA